MARGWESKAVEQQQAEAIALTAAPKTRMTPLEAAERQKRENLLLARKHVLETLVGVREVRYRQMLENTLADLDAKLARLG